MACQQALEQRFVEFVDVAGDVNDRVLGIDLQRDADVAELQVGVEHDHPFRLAPHGQGERRVGAGHGLAGATLGRHDRDDLADSGPADGIGVVPFDRLGNDAKRIFDLPDRERRFDDVLESGTERRLQDIGRHVLRHQDEGQIRLDVEQQARLGDSSLMGVCRTDECHLYALFDEAALGIGDVPSRMRLVSLEEVAGVLDKTFVWIDEEDRVRGGATGQRFPPPELRGAREG